MDEHTIETEWDIDHAWHLLAGAVREADDYVESITRLDVELDSERQFEELPASSFENLCQLTDMLIGYSRTAYGAELPESIDVHPSLLSKLIRRKGAVKPTEVSHVIDQYRVLINQIESKLPDKQHQAVHNDLPANNNRIKVDGISWIAHDDTPEIRQLIYELTGKLEQVMSIISRSNSLALSKDVSEARIEQLKLLLRTALKVLESPLVETGILTKAGNFSKEIAAHAAKDEMQKGLGWLLENAGNSLLEFLVKIRHQ